MKCIRLIQTKNASRLLETHDMGGDALVSPHGGRQSSYGPTDRVAAEAHEAVAADSAGLVAAVTAIPSVWVDDWI